MRKGIGILLGAAFSIALVPLNLNAAAAQSSKPISMEKSLLGIRILQSYKEVLKKYGQPTRVYRRGEPILFDYSLDSKGKYTGGIRGLADMAQSSAGGGGTPGMGALPLPGGRPGGMGGGMPGSMGGMPAGMGGGMPGSMGGGRRMGGGMPAGMGGMPGSMGGRPAGMGGGMPGSMGGGMPGAMGGFPGAGAGAAGAAGAGGAQQEETFASAGGYIWVYLFPQKELCYVFVFNNDGRVMIISQTGRVGGVPTSKGIGLGMPVRSVYTAYGWPDSMANASTAMSLFYNEKYHVQFDVLNNRVVGINMMLREADKVRRLDSANQMAGGGLRGAGGGGALPGAGGGGGGGIGGGKAD